MNVERINHLKDLWYLFFFDHNLIFVFLLVLANIFAPLKSLGHGGIATQNAIFGYKTKGLERYFENSRWLIKTNSCIYDNIPKLFIVLIELLYKGNTITYGEVIVMSFLVIMSVRHLGFYTGENFRRSQDSEGIILPERNLQVHKIYDWYE
jgi:hypothetical protein